MQAGRALAAAAVLAATALAAMAAGAKQDDGAPQRGGVLRYAVPAQSPPSFDGHREATYALIHPVRPFYSTLIRVNPDNPDDPADFVCDLCAGDVPEPSEDGLVYAFRLREGVRFHDGAPLTSADVKASYDRIVFPPPGVLSARKSFYRMVAAIEAPDPRTVIFRLKYPSAAFIPALADPFNFIYSKAKLDRDPRWYETNVLGSGPFVFSSYEPGRDMTGVRNPDYYIEGQPYLDGFRAIFEPREDKQVEALLAGDIDAQFRGFPPKTRDELVRALGPRVHVQETDWNCVLLVTPNHERPPFDDVRVRRALTLAIDRWGGSQYLSKLALVKTVGGIVFPGHPLAASPEELMALDGYDPDLRASRARARVLLSDAGIDLDRTYVFNNRRVDQPYKAVGVWLIDQWRQIGLNFEQQVQTTPQYYATLRERRDFDVSIDFNCNAVVNPPIDTAKYLPSDHNPQNYSGVVDPELDALYEAMLLEPDPARQREKMRAYEKYVLHDQVTQMITLWWRRITVHRSRVRGWHISPSHYLGQALDSVWLDPAAEE